MTIAHRLNKRVLLQKRVSGKSPGGAPADTWQNVVSTGDGKIWADVRDLTGRQFVAAGGTQNEVQTKIEIRYRPGVTAAMRIVHGPEVYDIVAVLNQDDKSLQLMCSKGVSSG